MTVAISPSQVSIGSPRLASPSTVGGALTIYLALNLLIVFVLFPSGLLRSIAAPFGGLVTSTLLANLMLFAVVGGFLRWQGNLSSNDVGLRRRDLPSAIVGSLVVWVIVNAIEGWPVFRLGDALRIDPGWTQFGALRMFGVLIAQLFGNALFEEVLFRGLLFRQLQLWLLRKGTGAVRTLLIALVASQAIFALIHIPLRIATGTPATALPGEMLLLFALGILLALAYWKADNLPLVVGIHALSNAPLPLIEARVDLSTDGWIAAIGCIAIVLFWPRVNTEATHRGPAV